MCKQYRSPATINYTNVASGTINTPANSTPNCTRPAQSNPGRRQEAPLQVKPGPIVANNVPYVIWYAVPQAAGRHRSDMHLHEHSWYLFQKEVYYARKDKTEIYLFARIERDLVRI